MIWLIYSIIATLSAAIYVVFFKLCESSYDAESLLPWTLFLLFIPLFAYSKKITVHKWAILSGFLLSVYLLCFGKALSLTNNPGVPSALIRCETIFMYLASLYVFREKFNIKKFTAILLFIIGSISTIIPSLENSNTKWIGYVVIIIFGMMVNDTLTKWALKTIPTIEFLTTQVFVASICSFSWLFYKTRSVSLKKSHGEKLSKIPLLNEQPLLYFPILIISLLLFRICLTKSISLANNPTYPRAVINSQFVFSILLALLIEKNSSVSMYEGIGSILMLLGVSGTVLF